VILTLWPLRRVVAAVTGDPDTLVAREEYDEAEKVL